MQLEYGFSLATLAHKLRRFERVHRLVSWLRRGLGAAFVEAGWEFARRVLSFCPRLGPPTSTFSIYQALRTNDPALQGRIILHDQGVPKVCQNSLFVLGTHNQHKEQPWPIFWSHHQTAHLGSKSLAMLEGKSVCVESVYGHAYLPNDPAFRFLHLPSPVNLQGNWTSIVSRWVPTAGPPNYTHWLLDALPRLALVSEFPSDTRIIVPSTLFPSELESLKLLGLLERCRFTPETHLEVENYFFSSPTSMLQGFNPYAVHFLRTALLPKKERNFSGPKKFFVARTGSVRNPNNLAELNNFFTSINWALIQPADLTFAQQIKLFSEAEAICGTVGSGLTNSVFCQPGCQIILLAQDFMLDGWLDWISQVIKADYRFLICPSGYRQEIRPELASIREVLSQLGHKL